jgi:hypothetical protein
MAQPANVSPPLQFSAQYTDERDRADEILLSFQRDKTMALSQKKDALRDIAFQAFYAHEKAIRDHIKETQRLAAILSKWRLPSAETICQHLEVSKFLYGDASRRIFDGMYSLSLEDLQAFIDEVNQVMAVEQTKETLHC